MSDAALADLLARYVAHREATGDRLSVAMLCGDDTGLVPALGAAIERYERLDGALDGDAADPTTPVRELPVFEGFRTVERLGGGGMGEVYKLEDLQLGRTVAAKVIRDDSELDPTLDDFLREASTLALFQDRRIVQIHEFRADADPPVLIMEHVEGFALDEMAASLEYGQRARILAEICDAIDHAHRLGLQHRDLKPANILLDARLEPRILDFGLSRGDPGRGHGVGTLPYLAPEQLDPTRPIDDRTDVYALGVIAYELLCGAQPYTDDDDEALISAIRAGRPRLPVEVEPSVPEPLQAIALKAMEIDPTDRYPSAREMARELRRFVEGRPVLARPTLYSSALERRALPHLEQVEEWLRLKLIYPSEARRLRREYRRLSGREDDWIVESRQLSHAQVALYMGAFVLACGGLLYFAAHRFFDAVDGVLRPLAALGLPFAALNGAAFALYRREHRAAAVAFALGGVLLLPLLVMILLTEAQIGSAAADAAGQLFSGGALSNRQLQVAAVLTAAWACLLAWRTRTSALASVFTASAGLLWLAWLADLGLGDWLRDGRWDLLAFYLMPLIPLLGIGGRWTEVRGLTWFGKPLVLGCAVLFVISLELLAQQGRQLGYLGLSLAAMQPEDVTNPLLLDTLAAMTINGLLIYGAGALLERYGGEPTGPATWVLLTLSPFAILEPVAWLCATGQYAHGFDALYLLLGIGIAVLSQRQQRRAFFFAGLVNSGVALLLLSHHRAWFDDPWWAVLVIGGGLTLLVVGLGIDRWERVMRRRPRS
jgi:serine/threonine protein kinase